MIKKLQVVGGDECEHKLRHVQRGCARRGRRARDSHVHHYNAHRCAEYVIVRILIKQRGGLAQQPRLAVNRHRRHGRPACLHRKGQKSVHGIPHAPLRYADGFWGLLMGCGVR